MARKEYKKAISVYRKRLNRQPKDLPTKFSLADALLADNQVDEALEQYRELAEIFTKEGFLLKAIALYKKMLKIRPDWKEVETLLSELAQKKDEDHVRTRQSKEMVSATQDASRASNLDIESKLLNNLSYEEFRRFVNYFILHHFDEETIIVKEGDPGNSLFIIVRGEVRVITQDSKKREMVLSILREGDLFGEIALLTGKPRTATVITNMATELLELSRSDYNKLISKHPRIKKVVEALHQARAHKTVEAMIQSYREKSK